jgi:hypothetical protein
MPCAKPFRQCSPFTAILRNMQNCIDDSRILMRDIAALTRQMALNSFELFSADFHLGIPSIRVNSP